MPNLPGLALADALLYLDPGSGSFIIQLLLGLALGAGVAIKMYWAKLKGLVTGKKSPPQNPAEKMDDD
jgi:hypothetical protein